MKVEQLQYQVKIAREVAESAYKTWKLTYDAYEEARKARDRADYALHVATVLLEEATEEAS